MHLVEEYSFVIVEEGDDTPTIVRWLLERTTAPSVDTSTNSWIHTLTPGAVIILNNANHSPRFTWGFDLTGGINTAEDRFTFLLKLMNSSNLNEEERAQVLAQLSEAGKEYEKEQEVRIREDTVPDLNEH
jgi:hypothetical protein